MTTDASNPPGEPPTASTASKPPTFLSAEAGEWQPIAPQDPEKSLSRALRDPLTSEKVIVLAGLGTSMAIKVDGESIAPSMSDLWLAVASLDEFDAITDKLAEHVERKNFEELLSACQFHLEVNKDDQQIADFVKVAEAAALKACRFLDDVETLPAHQTFLRKVASRDARLPRTQIFTTNYDRAFEEAAANIGFTLIDGFRADEPRRFDGGYFDLDLVRRGRNGEVSFEPNVALLVKLHGSVDWERDGVHVVKRDGTLDPVMIYPRASKFQLAFQNPYLECMARFQTALREDRTTLIVAGTGFNDEHLAAPVRAALEGNVGLRVIVADPAIDTLATPTAKLLRELVSKGDRRITLVAAGFDEFANSLPEAREPSDDDLHRQRFNEAMQTSGASDA